MFQVYGIVLALNLTYHKQGKICWAKLSQIPPNEVIHWKTFAVPYV